MRKNKLLYARDLIDFGILIDSDDLNYLLYLNDEIWLDESGLWTREPSTNTKKWFSVQKVILGIVGTVFVVRFLNGESLDLRRSNLEIREHIYDKITLDKYLGYNVILHPTPPYLRSK
jgi:hypothetical protein